jgi:hypothetical protein
MQRRAFIALGAAALAGCGGFERSEPTATPTETTPTPTATATATPTDTTPSSVDPDRTYEEAIRTDFISVFITGWGYRSRIRWFSDAAQELKYVESEDGVFWTISLAVQNLNDEGIQLPDLDQFDLLVNDIQYSRSRELPDGVEWEEVRERPEFRSVPDSTDYNEWPAPDPGQRTYLTLLYEAPEGSEPYLVWDHGQTVNGHEQPVFIDPLDYDRST